MQSVAQGAGCLPTGGRREIPMDPTILRLDVDAPCGCGFIEIGILKGSERLDLVVRGELVTVPASPQCAQQGDR